MNSPLDRLIAKDWYIHRRIVLTYILAGALALGITVFGGGGLTFVLGAVLLLAVLGAGGIHVVFVSVLHERVEHTLAFVMSLPVSAAGYGLAKVASTLLIFSVVWLSLVAVVFLAIYGTPIPDAFAPVAAAILLQQFLGFSFILGVAIVTESQGWTVGGIIASILSINVLVPVVLRLPEVRRVSAASLPDWSGTVGHIVQAQLALILVILLGTIALQSRKRDFI